MLSIVPLGRLGAQEPDKRLMYDDCGLEGVIAALPPHMQRSDFAEFALDDLDLGAVAEELAELVAEVRVMNAPEVIA